MSIGGFLTNVLRTLADRFEPQLETHTTDDGEYWEYDDEESDEYAAYADVMSTDNPFLDYEATGFVFGTLSAAWTANWPSVLLAPSLAADSVENAVLSSLELFTDNNERSAKGILFEAGRLIAGKLDVDPEQALRMKVLGVYDTTDHKLKNDPFVSDGCLYMIQAFLNDEFEDAFAEVVGLPSLAYSLAQYLVKEHTLDSSIDAYRILTVTILMIGTRQWITDEFPEFEGAYEDVAGE